MPRTGRIGEQHDTCAISGFVFPVSEMLLQRGRHVSFRHSDKTPNADFYRENWDVMEDIEGETFILPEGPLEDIAPP